MDLDNICKIIDSINESTSKLEDMVKAEKSWLHGNTADMSADHIENLADHISPIPSVVGEEVPYEIIETEDDHHYFLEVYAKLPNGKKAYQSAIRIEKKIYK